MGSLEDLFLQWTGDTGHHETVPSSDKRDKRDQKEKEVVQR